MAPDPALAAAQGKKKKLVHCTNVHIVSGSKKIKHQIPGDKALKRLTFKIEVLTQAMNASIVEAEKYSESVNADQRRSNHPIFWLLHDI